MNAQSTRPSAPRRPWGALLLVAAIGLRALVPAGFMLAPVGGHAQMVLCGVHLAGGVHSHGGPADHAGRHAGGDPACPFAQSAAPAVLAALPVALPPYDGALRLPLPAEVLPFVPSGPHRQPSQRGPPHLT